MPDKELSFLLKWMDTQRRLRLRLATFFFCLIYNSFIIVSCYVQLLTELGKRCSPTTLASVHTPPSEVNGVFLESYRGVYHRCLLVGR